MKKILVVLLVCVAAGGCARQNNAPEGFVRIKGGTFTMGSSSDEDQYKTIIGSLYMGKHEWEFVDKEVQHQVTVGSFYMGKYEVTQKEWYDVMGTTVQQQRDKADKSWPTAGEGDNYPMYYVSWLEAAEYCNKRSQKEGLTPAYTINGTNVTWNRNANGYRLPTEAEWEYACRAGTKTPWHSGTEKKLDNYAWIDTNSDDKTHEVGKKQPNAFGLYDMHGNVFEWCWDWYEAYSSGAQTDPVGASSGSDRVKRGGSWYDAAVDVRSAYRDYGDPDDRDNDLGFRLVLNEK